MVELKLITKADNGGRSDRSTEDVSRRVMARVSSNEPRKEVKSPFLEREAMATEVAACQSAPQQSISLQTLSPEVLGLILRCLSAKTLLNISETCRSLHSECLGNGALWKELCKVDFQIQLLVKGQFDSYHDIYRLLFKSQIIFEERNHVTFSGMLPDWMFTWCIMSNTPPNLKFFLLPIGKAKRIWGLQDDELPRGEPNVSRRSIAWSEGFDAALAKWGSEAAFQEQVLRRMTRSQKKVDCLYMPELQSRRKRFYKRLRMGEKYAAMNDILVKNKNTHIYLSYFEPQLIGEHYINGKLHRFGRKQLKEYMKFAIKLYDSVKASNEECRESDLIECVLLTYKDLALRVEGHFLKWKEFLEYSQKFLVRQQKVWRWQTEKSIAHCIKYRPCEKVQAMPAYKDYIQTGDARRFRLLRRHFEGHEKICQWVDLNNWVLDIVDHSTQKALLEREESDLLLTNEARELRRSIDVFLQSGKDYDFRMVLWTISTIAKGRLKQSASLVKELECVIKTDRSNVLVSVETELLSKDLRRYRPLSSVLSAEHRVGKTKHGKSSPKPVFMRFKPRRSKRPLEATEETPPDPSSDLASLAYAANSSAGEANSTAANAHPSIPEGNNTADISPPYREVPRRIPCAGSSSQETRTHGEGSSHNIECSSHVALPTKESPCLHFLRKRSRFSSEDRRAYQNRHSHSFSHQAGLNS